MTSVNHDCIPPFKDGEIVQQIVEALTISCPKSASKNYHKAGFKKSGKQRYYCNNCQHKFVLNPDFQRLKKSGDVWSASELGLQVSPPQNNADKLNFSYIQREWLKQYIKKFIKYSATQTTIFELLQQSLYHFRLGYKFLLPQQTISDIKDINRSIIIDYLNYLNQQLAPATKSKSISIASLFETGVANKWFNVESYLSRNEDYPRRSKSLPRYIPDEVLRQLNQHLDTLPEPVARMILVIQECGLRIGELCQLPFNCLKQDGKGG